MMRIKLLIGFEGGDIHQALGFPTLDLEKSG